MKETYFDQKTIAQRGLDFLKRIACTGDRALSELKREKAALLILDMQDYFLHPESHAFVPSGPAIVPYLTEMVDVFKKENIPVIFTRHLNTEQDAGQMNSWWSDLITAENPLSALHENFSSLDAPVVPKTQYDAFFKTGLHQLLEERGIRQLIIGGLMTHLCCESTARSGFILGYEVFFGVDFTATYNADFHCATLMNISHGFGIPVLFDEVMEILGYGSPK